MHVYFRLILTCSGNGWSKSRHKIFSEHITFLSVWSLFTLSTYLISVHLFIYILLCKILHIFLNESILQYAWINVSVCVNWFVFLKGDISIYYSFFLALQDISFIFSHKQWFIHSMIIFVFDSRNFIVSFSPPYFPLLSIFHFLRLFKRRVNLSMLEILLSLTEHAWLYAR